MVMNFLKWNCFLLANQIISYFNQFRLHCLQKDVQFLCIFFFNLNKAFKTAVVNVTSMQLFAEMGVATTPQAISKHFLNANRRSGTTDIDTRYGHVCKILVNRINIFFVCNALFLWLKVVPVKRCHSPSRVNLSALFYDKKVEPFSRPNSQRLYMLRLCRLDRVDPVGRPKCLYGEKLAWLGL